MATTLFNVGWELGLIETPLTFTNGSAGVSTVSTTKTRSGTYALQMGLNATASYGRAIASTTELRANVAINHIGHGSGNTSVDRSAIIFQVGRLDGTGWRFTWQQSNRLFYVTTLAAATVAIASGYESNSSWTMRDTWHDLSIAIKVDGTAGWLKLYCNGVEVLSFTGNTDTSPIVSVAVGGASSNDNTWLGSAYFDDFYVEDTTGETATPAINRKFVYYPVNGDGSSSTFVGVDGDSTNNYLHVDDFPIHDADSTYVAATAAAQEDLYTHTTVTTPSNHVISALQPTIVARKTNAAVDTEIQLELFKSATDSVAAAQDLTTAYGLIVSRFTALPDASPLNDANLNSTEIGYISAGAYA